LFGPNARCCTIGADDVGVAPFHALLFLAVGDDVLVTDAIFRYLRAEAERPAPMMLACTQTG
jgi:hypothetical protein